jgi:hypothetical protein
MNRSDALRDRRQRVVAALPPLTAILRGSFFVRHRRCGKPTCRCARGSGHRVAVVSVTFRDGSTEQIAVSRDLEPLARTWVQNYARWWDAVERISAVNRQLLRRRLVGPTG